MKLGVSAGREAFLESFFKSIDNEDWSSLTAWLHPEVTYERPGYDPFVGRDRVMSFYRHERIIVEGLHTIERALIQDDDLICLGTFRGVSRAGEALAIQFADAYQFDMDRVRTRRTYFYTAAI